MVVTISSSGLADGTIWANGSIIATALMAHPLAQQFDAGTIEVLTAMEQAGLAISREASA